MNFRTHFSAVVLSALFTWPALAQPGGSIYVYDGSVMPMPIGKFKGIMVLHEGGKKTTEIKAMEMLAGKNLVSLDATEVHRNLELVQEFYSRVFGREGYDGHRADVHVSVNMSREFVVDLLGTRRNASWNPLGSFFMFGHGEGEFKSFSRALDVVGHEFTHAVISSTSNLTYAGQSGALNEHFADVMGAAVRQHYDPATPNAFLIGDSIITDEAKARRNIRALRDMELPKKGFRAQPAHVSEIAEEFRGDCRPDAKNDACGVHILSGIPNRAASMIIKDLGWETARKMFYEAMVSLKSDATFVDYRAALEKAATPVAPAALESVARAMDAVGIAKP